MAEMRGMAREVLARHELLAHMSPAELERLAEKAVLRTYEPHQVIFSRGDAGTAMMAVLSGRVRISCYSPEGREMVFAVLGAKEVFGEIALIDGGERTADAVALEPTELLVFHRRDFLPILENNPKVAIRFLEMFCQRLRQTNEYLEDMNFLQLKSRLAKRLMSLAELYGQKTPQGTKIDINLPQHLLASMMGTSREAVNKQLRAWEEAGILDFHRGAITLLDIAGLEQIVRNRD